MEHQVFPYGVTTLFLFLFMGERERGRLNVDFSLGLFCVSGVYCAAPGFQVRGLRFGGKGVCDFGLLEGLMEKIYRII